VAGLPVGLPTLPGVLPPFPARIVPLRRETEGEEAVDA
jgi:hypothetical protein